MRTHFPGSSNSLLHNNTVRFITRYLGELTTEHFVPGENGNIISYKYKICGKEEEIKLGGIKACCQKGCIVTAIIVSAF
jgi:hypothetical protein